MDFVWKQWDCFPWKQIHSCACVFMPPHGIIGSPGLTALGISQTPWTLPSAGLTYIGAFTVLPFVLRLHKPAQGSTSSELCSGQGHRCSSDCLQVFLTIVPLSMPALSHGVIAPCALWGPSLALLRLLSGVAWDLGGTEDSHSSCPTQPLAVF